VPGPGFEARDIVAEAPVLPDAARFLHRAAELAPLHIDDEPRLIGRNHQEIGRLHRVVVEIAAPGFHDRQRRNPALAQIGFEGDFVVVVGLHDSSNGEN